MTQDNVLHVQVHVANDYGVRDPFGWIQITLDAIAHAAAELSAEGVPTSVRRPTASEVGPRAAGIDDLVVSVPANAVSNFLLRVVQDLQRRFARHHSTPRAIVLQTAWRRLELPIDAPVHADAHQMQELAAAIAEHRELTTTILK
jgi:hypothetical protein